MRFAANILSYPEGLDLRGCDVTECKFNSADMRGVQIEWEQLKRVEFTGAKLPSSIDLRNCDLSGLKCFLHCDLRQVQP